MWPARTCKYRHRWPIYLSTLSLLLILPAAPISFALALNAEEDDEQNESQSDDDDGIEINLQLGTDHRKVLPEPENSRNSEDEDQVALDVSWRSSITESWTFGAAVVAESLRERNPEQPDWRHRSHLYLDELFVDWSVQDSHYPAIRVGRQEVAETRGWWWDETLDAVVFHGNAQRWHYQTGIGRFADYLGSDSEPHDPEQEELYWAFAEISAAPSDHRRYSAYLMGQFDRSDSNEREMILLEADADESDANISWLGLRVNQRLAKGRWGDLGWRIDSGVMRGHERLTEYEEDEDNEDGVDEGGEDQDESGDAGSSDNDESDAESSANQDTLTVSSVDRFRISGWAVDTALEWRTPLPLQPVVTLQYASGSGTPASRNPGSRSYRQSGIHDNSDTFGYYGELFDPALTNIDIRSLSITWPFADTASLSLAHHRYRKRHGSDDVGDTGVDADPETQHRNLGTESGLYLSVESLEDWQVDISWSTFEAGMAYGLRAGKSSQLVRIDIEYEF